MTAAGWFVLIFWVLAAVAVALGIAISAEEYLTEKKYSSGSKGEHNAER